jgi:cyclic pyranopterin phosphate synthase
MGFTHVDSEGRARMVDVSNKPKVRRTAEAFGKILLNPRTLKLIQENQIKKGDVLTVAKIAGIAGAKRTADLIPLCHNIEIDQVDLDLELTDRSVDIRSRAVCTDKTGIEMEALTAVSVAALTIYDMCKAVDKDMSITDIRLIEKTKDAHTEEEP